MGLFLIAFAPTAQASIEEIQVLAVGVDESSVKAREIAMDYARKRALYLAAKKRAIPNAPAQLARLNERQINEIIRGVTVRNQTRKGEATYLDTTVTIIEPALLRALRLPADFGKAVVDKPVMRAVLLLSLYVGKDRPYLWEKENELRPLLSDETRRQSYGGVLLPGGDLEDLRLIDYQNALTVTPEELKPMFTRYGAEEIVLAVLTLGAPGTTDASSVLLRRLKAHGAIINQTLDVPVSDANETTKTRIEKAAAAIATAVTEIATSTADRDAVARAAAPKIKATFRYSTPQDLARMQAAVRGAPEVLALEMPSISLARVSATLYLKGEREALRQRLTKEGVVVTVKGDDWQFSVR